VYSGIDALELRKIEERTLHELRERAKAGFTDGDKINGYATGLLILTRVENKKANWM
jgi:hypothetical protein